MTPEPGVTYDEAYDGTCWVCGEFGSFVRAARSIREGFPCPACRASLRYQGQAHALLRHVGSEDRSLKEHVSSGALTDVRIYEPGSIGPFRALFASLPRYTTSYYDPHLQAGTSADERHQDLTDLTYPDACMDLVLTSDVFEHVRHPARAFAEVHRVLVPGGAHIFTVPIEHPMPRGTTPRVDVSGAEDVHILPPAYHGSPHGQRHLVYNDFGEDVVDLLSEVGFVTTVERFPSYCASAGRLVTFVSVK